VPLTTYMRTRYKVLRKLEEKSLEEFHDLRKILLSDAIAYKKVLYEETNGKKVLEYLYDFGNFLLKDAYWSIYVIGESEAALNSFYELFNRKMEELRKLYKHRASIPIRAKKLPRKTRRICAAIIMLKMGFSRNFHKEIKTIDGKLKPHFVKHDVAAIISNDRVDFYSQSKFDKKILEQFKNTCVRVFGKYIFDENQQIPSKGSHSTIRRIASRLLRGAGKVLIRSITSQNWLVLFVSPKTNILTLLRKVDPPIEICFNIKKFGYILSGHITLSTQCTEMKDDATRRKIATLVRYYSDMYREELRDF